jgi:KAP family P-loop domain
MVAPLTLNEAARGALEEYLIRPSPGYALLIDAPWGAGKTYFIDHVTNHKTDKEILYVSLYGVSTTEQFDWALVRAIQPFADSSASKYAKIAKDVASGVKFFGVSIDLSKVSLTEVILEKLPETLIFDDLERCHLLPNKLFGLLNRFVEHQGKRIILVANSGKHPDKQAFDTRKEKLIGRTITIEADPEAAIESFWRDVPEGVGKTFLKENKSPLIRVFRQAGHNNLRLFRQSLMDAARFIELLPDEVRKNEAATDLLIRTFLALSMALAGGEITLEDLARRNEYRSFVDEKDSHETKSLKTLMERHPDCDIQGYHNSILPTDLGVALIGRGFVTAEQVEASISGNYQLFAEEKISLPDWVRLWNWWKESENEAACVLQQVEAQLSRDEIHNPSEILQIYGAQKFMQFWGAISGNPTDLVTKFVTIIRRLESKKLLSPFVPDSLHSSGYGYSFEGGRISYGGYSFDLNENSLSVVETMQAAQKSLFDQALPSNIDKLIDEIPGDPNAFALLFTFDSRKSNFSQLPVLQHSSASKFAKVLFDLITERREEALIICKPLKERNEANRTEFAPEQEWLQRVGQEVWQLAQTHTPLLQGQIRIFLNWQLGVKVEITGVDTENAGTGVST